VADGRAVPVVAVDQHDDVTRARLGLAEHAPLDRRLDLRFGGDPADLVRLQGGSDVDQETAHARPSFSSQPGTMTRDTGMPISGWVRSISSGGE